MNRGTDPIPDRKLNALMNVIYNVWFRKWKSLPTEKWDEASWKQMIEEADQIWEQGAEYHIVGDLIMAFVNEFDLRWKAWCKEHSEK